MRNWELQNNNLHYQILRLKQRKSPLHPINVKLLQRRELAAHVKPKKEAGIVGNIRNKQEKVMIKILFWAFIVFTPIALSQTDCSDAYSSAEDTYSYSRKAYYSEDHEDIIYYIRKVMNSAEETTNYSDDCGCDDAYSSAEESYSYLKKARNNIKEADYYLKKAMSSVEDAMGFLDDCSSNSESEDYDNENEDA